MRHEARQAPSWLISDVGQKLSTQMDSGSVKRVDGKRGATGYWVMFAAGVTLFVVFGGLVFKYLVLDPRLAAAQQSWVAAEATVLSTTVVPVGGSRREGLGWSHEKIYRFLSPSGVEVHGRIREGKWPLSEQSEAEARLAVPGEKLPVWYDAANPRRHTLRRDNISAGWNLAIVAGLIPAICGVVVAVVSAVRLGKRDRAT